MNSLIEIDHAGSIYTTKISKHYNKPECLCILFIYLESWLLSIYQHNTLAAREAGNTAVHFPAFQRTLKGKWKGCPLTLPGMHPIVNTHMCEMTYD